MLVRPRLWGQSLSGAVLALGLSASLLAAVQRLLYPVAALTLLDGAGAPLGLSLLVAAFGLSAARISISKAIAERVRRQAYKRLGGALRRLPAIFPPDLPSAEQLGPLVARSLPLIEAHYAQTLPVLLGNALTLPALVGLCLLQPGGNVVLKGAVALGAGAAAAAMAWRGASRLTRRAAQEYRAIASTVDRGVRARVEMRVHNLGERLEAQLAEQVGRWARTERRAQLWRGLTGWSLPIFVATALLIGASVAGASIDDWFALLGRSGRQTAALGVLLIALFPVLLGLSRGLANALYERSYIDGVVPLLRFVDSELELRPAAGQQGHVGEIWLKEVGLAFPARDGGEATVVRANLRMREEESVALLGPNGCGKTSLALAVMGLVRPSEGQCVASVDGSWVDVTRLGEGAFAYLPQETYFAGGESVWGAISFVAPNARKEDAQALLERLLGARAALQILERDVTRLSAGQKRIVALVRVLLRPAVLTVLDEPETNLDVTVVARVVELLRELTATRRLLILTHDPRFLDVASRVLCFDESHSLRDPELEHGISIANDSV